MRVLLIHKNFAGPGISHIGLGVAAINTAKVLRRAGYRVEVAGIKAGAELTELLRKMPDTTHMVISAPWIDALVLAQIVQKHCEVQFVVNCHSNVGFLQADTNALRLLTQYMNIERSSFNFRLAGNSERLASWIQRVYQIDCQFLPNLYYLDHLSGQGRPPYNGGALRIGMFGAIRPLKNMLSGAAAPLHMARREREPLTLAVSANRSEGGGDLVLNNIRAMFAPLPWAQVAPQPWAPWPEFRRIVANQHLLLQPSYSESFNMVTADGIAEGVGSVVSDAITWAPGRWKAETDDVDAIARVGSHLLRDREVAHDGLKSLQHYLKNGLEAWKGWLQ